MKILRTSAADTQNVWLISRNELEALKETHYWWLDVNANSTEIITVIGGKK
jgi:hypothetical protein